MAAGDQKVQEDVIFAEPTTWTRNTEITLDATASSDADGDPLSFEWTLVQEPASAGGDHGGQQHERGD